MAHIFPSLISSNILQLNKQIEIIDPYADGYHLDVMDFNFVPNLTWGPTFVNAIRTTTKKPLYIHLMVCDPKKYLTKLILNKEDTISFHIEQCSDKNTINYNYAKTYIIDIKKHNFRASIAIKPSTPIITLEPLLAQVDDILLMSVEPGFSGQKFLEASYKRLEELIALKKQQSTPFTITMDGGIDEHNITKLTKIGVDCFGIASAIFNQKNPTEALIRLKKLADH